MILSPKWTSPFKMVIDSTIVIGYILHCFQNGRAFRSDFCDIIILQWRHKKIKQHLNNRMLKRQPRYQASLLEPLILPSKERMFFALPKNKISVLREVRIFQLGRRSPNFFAKILWLYANFIKWERKLWRFHNSQTKLQIWREKEWTQRF